MVTDIYEVHRGEYTISTDKAKLDIDVIHHFLSKESYWSPGIPKETVERAIAGGLCFGVYHGNRQVGYAKVITDFATTAYIGDVFVIKEYRGKGLSKWLMETMLAHPRMQGLRRWILATADAHSLYSQFGFVPVTKPERWMERTDPNVYAPKQ